VWYNTIPPLTVLHPPAPTADAAGDSPEQRMPAIIYVDRCAPCGGRHTLCLDDHRLIWLHRDFEYT
jgi:hypothetical protein